MKYIPKIFLNLAVVGAILILAGCGKVSDPVPYENSGYPHSYPRF